MQNELFVHGCVYHVFNRGNNKEDIFKEPKNYAYFLGLMKKYLLPIADVYAYCLLKNHFHTLIRVKEKNEIENIRWRDKPYLGFSHLFNSYTQAFNKLYGRQGSLFQEHPKRIKVDDAKYLIQLITYIHLNPVKHEFSEDVSYPYSSYNAITSAKPTSIARELVLEYFNDVDNFKYWHDLRKERAKQIINSMED